MGRRVGVVDVDWYFYLAELENEPLQLRLLAARAIPTPQSRNFHIHQLIFRSIGRQPLFSSIILPGKHMVVSVKTSRGLYLLAKIVFI